MRRLSILLVAVLAALVIAAFAGAGAASATVLCKENTSTCAAESIYPSSTTVSASLKPETKVEIVTSIGTIRCSSSTISGKTTAEKGAPLPVEVSSLSVSGCAQPGPCKVTEAEVRNLPYSAGVERTEAGNGTFSLGSGGKGNPSLKFNNCNLIFTEATCVWGGPITLTLTGGNPASLVAKEKILKRETEGGGSKFCPSTVEFSASYEITSPNPAYVRAGAGVGNTVICQENAALCPTKSTYHSGTAIEASAKTPEIELGGVQTVACESSAMSLESAAESGKPLVLNTHSFTFSNCTGGCETVEGQFELTSLEATTAGNGTMKTTFNLHMTGCKEQGLKVTCQYRAEMVEAPVVGGVSGSAKIEPKVTLSRSTVNGGSTFCPATMELRAAYLLQTPSPFWLTKAEA